MKIFGKNKYDQNPILKKLTYYALQCISTKKRTFLTILVFHTPVLFYAYYTHPQIINKNISRSTEVLSEIQIPQFLRNHIYSWYCNKYNVNIQEMVKPLDYYPTFGQFFSRRIKKRDIKQGENIVCAPADSKILSLREITTDQCFVIKGYNYKFGQFICGQDVQFEKQDFDLLKKHPSNKLYQAVLYLSPGDYHRFHSPIDYDVLKRKVINGYLFSVSEKSLLNRKKVYEKNARLVLHGKWKQGYLGMVMVGALNVGKIVLSQNKSFQKGQQMGHFSLGSTIVLLIEANNLQWKAKEGDKIQYGSELAIVENATQPKEKNSNITKTAKENFSIFDFFRKYIPF